MTTPSAGICAAPISKSSKAQPTTKTNTDVKIPLAISGSARPRNMAKAVRRRRHQRRERLRPPLPADRHRHAEDPGHRREVDRVPGHEELVVLELREAPDVDEEEELEDRPAEHGRDVVRPVHPVEERAVRVVAADEEDAQVLSHAIARRRPLAGEPLEVAEAVVPDHEVAGRRGPGTSRCRARRCRRAPPRATPALPRSAPAPRKEGAPSRAGSKSAVRSPVTSQIGNSRRFESAFAFR